MATLARLPDWSARLWAAIEARRRQPHVWGENDCALFAAACVEAVTGVDIAGRFRGGYDSEDSAADVLEANGWSDLEDLADAFLPRLDIASGARPRRGDVVLLPAPGGLSYIAVMASGGQAVAPEADGARLRPITGMRAAWSVG